MKMESARRMARRESSGGSRVIGAAEENSLEGADDVADVPLNACGIRNYGESAARSAKEESLYAVGSANANESGKPQESEAENQRSVRSPAPTWACNLYFPLPFFSKERNKPPCDSPKGAASMPPDMTEASTWL